MSSHDSILGKDIEKLLQIKSMTYWVLCKDWMVPGRNQYCCMLIHNRIVTAFINVTVLRIILNNNYINQMIIKLIIQKYLSFIPQMIQSLDTSHFILHLISELLGGM